MIFGNRGFDDSEVMRELERLEAKKNPDAVWKPEMKKRASAEFKSDDPFHNTIVLVAKLREAGRNADADSLMTKLAAYQNTHLYRAIDEDGEDLLDFAYPDGDVEVSPSKDGHGKVETPQSQHKKIVDIIQKTPTGKYSTAQDRLLDEVAMDLGLKKKANIDPNVLDGLINIYESFNDDRARFQVGVDGLSKISIQLVNDNYLNIVIAYLERKPTLIRPTKAWGTFKAFHKDAQQFVREYESVEKDTEINKVIFKNLGIANNNLSLSIKNFGKKLYKIKNLIKENKISEAYDLFLTISGTREDHKDGSLWLLHLIINDKSYYEKINKQIYRIKTELKTVVDNIEKKEQEKINSKFRKRMLIAKSRYDKALSLTPANWVDVRKYCSDLSSAIFNNQANPLRAAEVVSQTNRFASGFINVNNNEQALALFEKDSLDALNKIQNTKTSSLKSKLNKTSQIGSIPIPAPATAPAPAKPAPARRAPSSVATAPSSIPEKEYNAVIAMQTALKRLADTLIKENKITNDEYKILIGTGPGSGQAAGITADAIDGRWGENTSKALRAASKYFNVGDESLSYNNYPIGKGRDRSNNIDYADLATRNFQIINKKINELGGNPVGSSASENILLDEFRRNNLYEDDLSSFENLDIFLGVTEFPNHQTLEGFKNALVQMRGSAIGNFREAKENDDDEARNTARKYYRLVMSLFEKLKKVETNFGVGTTLTGSQIDEAVSGHKSQDSATKAENSATKTQAPEAEEEGLNIERVKAVFPITKDKLYPRRMQEYDGLSLDQKYIAGVAASRIVSETILYNWLNVSNISISFTTLFGKINRVKWADILKYLGYNPNASLPSHIYYEDQTLTKKTNKKPIATTWSNLENISDSNVIKKHIIQKFKAKAVYDMCQILIHDIGIVIRGFYQKSGRSEMEADVIAEYGNYWVYKLNALARNAEDNFEYTNRGLSQQFRNMDA